MENLKAKNSEEHSYLDAFRAFDINDRGYIQTSDIRSMLMSVMSEKSEKDKDLIQKVFHLDQNRRVTFEGN